MLKKFLTAAAVFVLPIASAAQSLDDVVEIDVLPGWRTSSGDHIAGLRIRLAPGWKTYWRAPGDAGIPPQFTFEGSDNISTISPHWPVPEVIDQNGLRSIGYHDNIVFPLTIETDTADAPAHFRGQITIGICEEICVPYNHTFDIELPVDGDRDTAITAALINQPLSQDEAQVDNVTCKIDPITDGLRVTATMDVPATVPTQAVVIESGDANVWVSEADVTRQANQLSATVDMIHSTDTAFGLDRSAVRITLLGDNQAVDIQGCNAG